MPMQAPLDQHPLHLPLQYLRSIRLVASKAPSSFDTTLVVYRVEVYAFAYTIVSGVSSEGIGADCRRIGRSARSDGQEVLSATRLCACGT